ncbi:hypothetical protein SODALDRAFT_304112 [Sodiomyces alkalinus F11]|uniref:Bacterial surface antigen (D15) domain-containing protein n=1 Tax=Sodiomyces alkalinus (strain CBS 110278 / VKM F-3762 / F11) TaxID=1314773 RepID=A0A3N2Q7Q8_SODAK|nr:hypothetical protein SODALDRAFT_304112 [Sodiomyces alkalinus F11]ROT42665.1 hypothetical protein SODALDRAFT_304112 [Sodiomyces alkalinus F11]
MASQLTEVVFRPFQQLQEQQLAPMTIHKLQVHGATNTRRSLLDPIFSPLVSDAANSGSTLGDVTNRLRDASHKLDRLGIFHPSPQIFLNSAQQTDPSSTPTDVDIDIALRELPRYKFNAGTDVGNAEGNAYTSLLCRNLFGGAELLNLHASAGTRTRSSYSAELSAPVLPASDSDGRLALEVLSSATDRPWASHEQVLRSATLRYAFRAPRTAASHTLEYSAAWRQLTSLAASASPTVRADAGDSFKSSLRHVFHLDCRDNPQLPQSGYAVRSVFELAGLGPLGGDVSFSKSELELSAATPLAPSWLRNTSLGAGLRLGMLYPLAPGLVSSGRGAPASRINDRFTLGGPTDVRGFALGGLGPHDGPDAVGGDVFAAASVNLLLPVPRTAPDSSLRFHLFANGGRLVAMKNRDKNAGGGASASTAAAGGLDAGSVARGMWGAVSDLVRGPPSVAAGLGIVYAHPVARFELNFSLPLILRRGEVGTKGVQVGVGINFL